MARFQDRRDAGRQLAAALSRYAERTDVTVLALPRGGVPVAYEVALALHAPLDVFLVRKLGVPGHEELAMGAIATGGVEVLNDEVVASFGISRETIDEVVRRELMELARRERAYRGDKPPPAIHGRTVLLVDDGLATGTSMRAAADALRRHGPETVVVAVPVGPTSTCRDLADEVGELVCVMRPEPFDAVGRWYVDFAQTSDHEVRDLLQRAEQARLDPFGHPR